MFLTLKVVILFASAFASAAVASPVGSSTLEEQHGVWDPSKVFEPGSEIPAKGELAKCVDTAVAKLGIDMNMQTDPALLSEILEKDMHLNDMPDVQKLVAADLTQKQSLRSMLSQVHEGVTQVHPAIGVTLCAALANEKTAAIFSTPNVALIKRTIHHMFLLDKIVRKLADDRVFLAQTYKHLQTKFSPSRLSRALSMFKAAGMFGVAKDYSVNKGIENYIELREKGSITPDEVTSRKRNLSTNILEATLTDFLHGYFPNARVGNTLAWQQPTNVEIVGENRVIQYGLSMDWARLYETWNLAFITGNLDFPNLLYPKLLIPSVLLADGKGYIYYRALALWLSINFYLLAASEAASAGQKHISFAGSSDLSTLWGKINLRYSNYLSSKAASDK